MTISRRGLFGVAAALAVRSQNNAPTLCMFSKHLAELNYDDLGKTVQRSRIRWRRSNSASERPRATSACGRRPAARRGCTPEAWPSGPDDHDGASFGFRSKRESDSSDRGARGRYVLQARLLEIRTRRPCEATQRGRGGYSRTRGTRGRTSHRVGTAQPFGNERGRSGVGTPGK